jgi:diguanylate cyclase (GGDEF)-like protein
MNQRSRELWALHFRDPPRAFEHAQRMLDDDASDASTRAWAALTIAFHHLFFTPRPEDAQRWLDGASAHFVPAGDRHGAILADVGRARLAIVRQQMPLARDLLVALRPEAQQALPSVDRFWLANALAACYYYTDQLDEAIACLYEAFESLRLEEPTPHLPTAMSNLAAALVTVGDYQPARELAQSALALLPQFNNPQLVLYTRSNLAEAQLGLGDLAAAVATIDAMMGDLGDTPRRAAQNHYLAIAAEAYASTGRAGDAVRCAGEAAAIFADYPGAFNDVHAAWAAAMAAMAASAGDASVALLDRAAEAAERKGFLPVLCKAHTLLAERHATAGRWEQAYRHSRRLLVAEQRRMQHRASAKYYLLRVQHELADARAERDRAHALRRETEALNTRHELLNAELSHRMQEIVTLQARLAREAVRDPLTQLFNRRYLDSVTPGLIAAARRRNAPLAVALVDLDRFKKVNDRHGHPAGDQVLSAIGHLLGSALRPADVVCRYGGEEFCLVLPDTNAAGAHKALASLADRLGRLAVDWSGVRLDGFTFSAGVAVTPGHGSTFSELIGAADRALYEAKAAGRNRVIEASAA